MRKGPLLLMIIHVAACWTTSAAKARRERRPSPPRRTAPALLRAFPALDERFLFNLPRNFVLPAAGDRLGARLLAEYGAVLVAGNGVSVPPCSIFAGEEEVAGFQAGLLISQGEYKLQAAAAEALAGARVEAQRHRRRISPAHPAAAARSYADTVTLWTSRVEAALRHWITQGRLNAGAARDIRSLNPREQTLAILLLEQQGMFCGAAFARSVLSSVAPPGASQHLALLAFDVKEHRDPTVRRILEHHGWYQTVMRDAPHFTYLGVPRSRLQSLGLMVVRDGDREYWLPRSASVSPTAANLAHSWSNGPRPWPRGHHADYGKLLQAAFLPPSRE